VLIGVSACALFAFVGACGHHEPHGPAKRVILITCDTLRPDRLGTYGYKLATSPNVDAFARESVVFEKAYSCAPWTGPSLCALHTGKLPDEIGVPGGNRAPLPAQAITLAELARKGGYGTAAIISNWVLRKPDKSRGDVGLQQGFALYDDEMTVKELNRDLYERRAPETTAAAVRWLEGEKSAANDRFFLWVHYQDPHGPYLPPPEILKRFERPMTDEPTLPVSATVKGKDAIPSYQALAGETRPEAYRMRYDAEIASFDEGFGRLIAKLKDLGWFDDTLIVFTADHGESLGEHGYWFCHGENLYQEEVHVPLAIHFPRGAKHVAGVASDRGERVKELAGHLDLWPTILEALGIDAPENRGLSLFRASLPEDRVNVQTLAPPPSPNRWEAVGDGSFRLVMRRGAEFELYDLEHDPGETVNVASKETTRAARLLQRMHAFVEEMKSAPLPEVEVKPDARTEKLMKGLGYTGEEDHPDDGHPRGGANRSPGTDARADIVAIESALKDYAIHHGGRYPDSLAVLVALDANGHAYLEGKKVPTDPWGRKYLYEPPAPSRSEPRVYTLGKDGKVGGEGDDADIDNLMLRNEHKK
jgi:arylsulfatase A-like enzyme